VLVRILFSEFLLALFDVLQPFGDELFQALVILGGVERNPARVYYALLRNLRGIAVFFLSLLLALSRALRLCLILDLRVLGPLLLRLNVLRGFLSLRLTLLLAFLVLLLRLRGLLILLRT
jgi:hypothetical protein